MVYLDIDYRWLIALGYRLSSLIFLQLSQFMPNRRVFHFTLHICFLNVWICTMYQDCPIYMLIQSEIMCNGHLESVETLSHRTQLEKRDRLPVLTVPCHAEPKAWEFERQGLCQMVTMYVMEGLQTEWAPLTVLVLNKHALVCFFSRYLEVESSDDLEIESNN